MSGLNQRFTKPSALIGPRVRISPPPPKMKTSVLIIAYNEEKHIGACIESVLRQTIPADEIIVVAHNCTDATERIAQLYPVKLVSFQGPVGIIYARIESLKQVTGDVVLCTDGDAVVDRNWIEVMTRVLVENKNMLVGSRVMFVGTFYNRFCNFLNTIVGWFLPCSGPKVTRVIWGPSIAFWAKNKYVVSDIFAQSYIWSRNLGLTRNPDDYWLALEMSKRGNIAYTTDTTVRAVAKELTSLDAYKRNRENNKHGKKIRAYFKSKYCHS